MTQQQRNKETVIRFNKEVIEQGNAASFSALVSPACINSTAPEGTPADAAGMLYFLHNILRAGFPDVKVTIQDQVAEEDRVTTRKQLLGTHTSNFMGIAPTGKHVCINVIDIIRLHNDQYVEHWGASNIAEVMAQLSAV